MNAASVCTPGPSAITIIIPNCDQPHLQSLQEWVFANTGLNYTPKKRAILYSRLQSLCGRLGLSGLAEMNHLLHGEGAEWLAPEVARAASTNFTFFFREIETLEFLRQRILPGLPIDGKWRIWSAAAASGEEAYSVAILLAEALGLEQAHERAAILGTDISYPMIEQAERAVYPENRVEALPADLRRRYLQPAGVDKWQVAASLRGLCTFRRLNLMTNPWPFQQPFDVILCRNIFYYFDKDNQLELIERLYDAAAPHAWLITSVTETFHAMPIRWRRVVAGVWRK
jgi:chemotaxis protein methyltransferase CheR